MRAYSRRELLRLGSAAAAVVLTGRCATRLSTSSAASRTRRLARVHVAPERIIRRTVGLRPFRPSGFVVRAENLDGKLLIHNYGHGGSGITLSWGTGELAADLLRESGFTGTGKASVLGCGVVGLTAARVLQRRGFEVTIYARELPPGTTSMAAGGLWYPAFLVDQARRTLEWDAQFERAARASHREFQLLVGEDYGVHWREQYYLAGDSGQDLPDWGLPELFPERRVLTAAENPFAAGHATVDHTLFIEPPIYLRALMRDFLLAGGRIVVREFLEPSQLSELSEPVVVNCTGLGSRDLFGDRELTPVKGQLTVLLPQPEVDYAVISGDLYMFSRRDGILLGGTHERGVETLEINVEAEERILAGHRALFDGMKG
jgi:glycine/D-amino acid oxidase-like deaminating enzyme